MQIAGVRPVPVVISHEQYQQMVGGNLIDVDSPYAGFKDRVEWICPNISSGIAEVVSTNDNEDGFHRITLFAI